MTRKEVIKRLNERLDSGELITVESCVGCPANNYKLNVHNSLNSRCDCVFEGVEAKQYKAKFFERGERCPLPSTDGDESWRQEKDYTLLGVGSKVMITKDDYLRVITDD